MEKLYLIHSDDDFLAEKEIDKLIKKHGVDSFNIVRYDFLTDNIDEIINDINTPNLLFEEKMIIVKNFTMLQEEKKNYKDAFYDIISNSNSNIIIFSASGKINNKAMLDLFKKNAKYINIEALDNEGVEEYICSRFKEAGFEFDQSLASLIANKSDFNLSIIDQEIEKLMLFKNDKKSIDYKDIELMVSDNTLSSIYDLIDAFIKNDKKTLLAIYNTFVLNNVDEMQILNAIINKLEEIYYVKALIRSGYAKDDIAAYFNVKPGRAYYMMKNANQINDTKYIDLVKKINQLDFNIKSGFIDKKNGLELFLLGA